MTNRLLSGVARVDARLLLKTLTYIASNAGVASTGLAEVTGLSVPSVKRLIANARQQYGVLITWRRDNSMPSHGEYTIDDWGVFNKDRVFEIMCL